MLVSILASMHIANKQTYIWAPCPACLRRTLLLIVILLNLSGTIVEQCLSFHFHSSDRTDECGSDNNVEPLLLNIIMSWLVSHTHATEWFLAISSESSIDRDYE